MPNFLKFFSESCLTKLEDWTRKVEANKIEANIPCRLLSLGTLLRPSSSKEIPQFVSLITYRVADKLPITENGNVAVAKKSKVDAASRSAWKKDDDFQILCDEHSLFLPVVWSSTSLFNTDFVMKVRNADTSIITNLGLLGWKKVVA